MTKEQRNPGYVRVIDQVIETNVDPCPSPADEQGWRLSEAVAARYLLGYEGRTRSAYASDLTLFSRWCAQQGLVPLHVDRAAVELYVRTLRGEGRARSTVARRCTVLSGYLAYAVDEGILDRNIMDKVKRPSVPKDSPQIGMTKEETLSFIDAARRTSPRLHLLVVLLILTGIRISEALQLDCGDLQMLNGRPVVFVQRKGGRRDVVPLPDRVAGLLHEHLAGRRSGPVFVTRTGARWDRHSAWRSINALSKRVFPERARSAGCHTLRGVNITHALAAGVPLHRVQQAAGHADSRQTLRYWRDSASLEGHANYAVADFLS